MHKKNLLLLAAVLCGTTQAQTVSETFNTGIKQLDTISGPGAGEKVFQGLSALSPDLATYVVEHGFGDIYARPGLDFKEKEITIIAALLAKGEVKSQVKSHMTAALNVGCSTEEIMEIIDHAATYAGTHAALVGKSALKEVIEDYKGTLPHKKC